MSRSFGREGRLVVIIAALALVIGVSVFYLGGATSSASTTTVETSTSTAHPASTASTTAPGGAQTSSNQGPQLGIEASNVSHLLSATLFSATCASNPALVVSYIKVTNTGVAPATISSVSFSFIDMTPVTESGIPTGACALGAGATGYVTFMGIGQDRAYAGESFTVTVNWGGGGFAYAEGNFN